MGHVDPETGSFGKARGLDFSQLVSQSVSGAAQQTLLSVGEAGMTRPTSERRGIFGPDSKVLIQRWE